MATLILGAVQLGLLYGIMALGMYISFRILNVPDLTTDGSIILGMSVCAMLSAAGHPYLGLLIAILSGAAAGVASGILQTKIGIHPVLSGILVMTSLYSVCLFVTGGKSNVSLNGKETFFTQIRNFFQNIFPEMDPVLAKNIAHTVGALLFAAVLAAILAVFFKTRSGITIRATGDNEDMVRSSSINAAFTKCVGLAIANACVALSGALISQYQMYFDAGFGTGMSVIGLASVIIGETVCGRRSVTVGLISAFIGSIIYRIIVAAALKVELLPTYGFKLVSALIVVIALAAPKIKEAAGIHKIRKNALKTELEGGKQA